MMRMSSIIRLAMGILGGILILSACGQTSPATQSTPIPFVDNATSTPSLIPSETFLPSVTPTPSITPLPTIPTFTPTFDVSTIVTVTPAPQAECPAPILYANSDFDLIDLMKNGGYANVEETIVWFLNQYDPQPLVEYASNSWGGLEAHTAFQDFTNDGLPELAMGTSIGITAFHIFGCTDGQYKELLHIPSNGLTGPATFFSIDDHNRNGIPEITLLTGFLSQGGHYYNVFEWDGERLANILSPSDPQDTNTGFIWVQATGGIHYEDVDKDLVQELVVNSGIPVWETYYSGLPWRDERTYYKWNGRNYVPSKDEFASPEFRFQAVQDGDLAVSQHQFVKALRLYQEAISNQALSSFSPEIRKNLQANWDSQLGPNPPPSLTPYPDDLTEYPRLAAYAYYRIMLLHLVQNRESDATTDYNTLQEKFESDPYGSPYVEMATAFWEAYQSTQRMYDGCAAAIQYAVEHPEILSPLGSDYHGWQSHTYVPEDVCPFR